MALEKDPHCVYALYGLGLVYDDLHQPQEAEAFLRRALHDDPRFSPLYEDLIKFYERQGRIPEADQIRDLMRRVLR